MSDEQITPDEIARHYRIAMDSVTLINKGKLDYQTDEEWADSLKRNVGHLEIMVAKTYWTTEDLTPFNEAIAKAA